MANDDNKEELAIAIVNQLKAYISDDDTYGALHVDITDLIEASEWFLAEIREHRGKVFDDESAEDFLINLDVNYVRHATFHLNSLSRNIKKILSDIANLTDQEDQLH